jgi:chromosome segregation ATPase
VSSAFSGRSSPSFLIGISVLVIGAVSYGAWSYLRPSQNARSERLVREFARGVGKEVNEFRRQARKIAHKKHAGPKEVEAALAAIDDTAAKTIDRIEEQADQIRDELVQLDIAIPTQRKRSRRLDTREEEAREEISGLATEAKSTLRGED